jgi:hypothetical protein
MFLTNRLLRTNEHVKKEAATTGEVSFWPRLCENAWVGII